MLRYRTLLVLLGAVNAVFALDPGKTLSQYSTSSWTQQQGLPQDTIRAITQTADGYLWLGTDEGVARFDGYEFTIFNRDHGDLPSNSVTALAAARDGSLWIGTRSGLTRYKDNRFHTYTQKDGMTEDRVSSLFVDHAGMLWVAAGGNLVRFDGVRFRNFLRERDIPLRSVRAIGEDSDHNLYLAGNSSVVKLVNGKFVDIFGPVVLRADFPSGLQVDNTGNLWITGVHGLIERLPGGEIRRYAAREGLSDSFGLNAIKVDRGGTIWVGTDRGLARLEGTRFRTRTEADLPSSVRCIFEDREGNLWIGSTRGLTRFKDDLFTVFGRNEGLPDDEPVALHQDRSGRNWAGFDQRVVLLAGKDLRPESVPSLPKLFVRQFRETADGEILIAAREGLVRYKDGRARLFNAPDPQNRKTVFDALKDPDGTLWLALPNGLGKLRGDRFETVIPAGPFYVENSFNSLARGPDGSIWAGTMNKGLWRYRAGEKRLYTARDGLGSDQIGSLYADSQGTLWVGTLDGGLSAFRGEKFIRYTARDGLLSDNIRGITDDGQSLWLSTTRGICRIAKEQLQSFADRKISNLSPRNFGVADGLHSAEANEGQLRSDGSLWFPTSRGIAVFRPKVQPATDLPPLVHLLEMSIDGQRFAPVDSARLPSGTGRLHFRFSAIHLAAPERVRYFYSLSGVDPGWIRANGPREVTYDGLRHGDYIFRVKAEVPFGPSSESTAAFDLLPHYYETAWFRLLCLSILAGGILMAYRLRDRRVRSRFALVLEERARLAREVHDTLAQGFVGIAAQLDVLEINMPPDSLPALSALELARRMARHSLTEARRSLVDLRSTALDDNNLGGALESGARLWTANSGIDVEVDIDGDACNLPEDIAHHVFRIAQEAVANTVNHANANQIVLKLRIEPAQLSLQVGDDGCGFEPDDVFTSRKGNFGLIGMRERAERLGGALHLESERGHGTRLYVTVPRR
jgi:ligand-binding sensor domain-containing protein/signal transduction histidine kinase